MCLKRITSDSLLWLAAQFAILFGIIILLSCGREDQRNFYRVQRDLGLSTIESLPGTGYVNRPFRQYVRRFEHAYGHKVINKVTIEFGDTDEGEAAHCLPSIMRRAGVPRITINQNYWNKYTADYQRELIVFHELGHCMLGRSHRENWGGIVSFELNSQTCAPLSIMYPEADWMLLNAYASHRDYYVRELVGKPINSGVFEIANNDCGYWLGKTSQKRLMQF